MELRNRKNIIMNENGSKCYEGEWKDAKRHDIGTLYLENNTIMQGVWDNGKPINIIIFDKNGNIVGTN